MTEEELIELYPRLWHMAEDGSWESIRKHGLLSTTALLDLYKITGAERHSIESQRRPESIAISAKDLPSAIIRDQKPMTKSALEKCLTGDIQPKEWFELLNGRVFFWLSRARLRDLLNARAYRGRPQTVLTIDTKSLVDAHRKNIELSPINSGATIYNPRPRGRETFLPVSDFPFAERRKTRPLKDTVVELVVKGGVSDISKHLVAAHRLHGKEQKELWRLPGSNAADGP